MPDPRKAVLVADTVTRMKAANTVFFADFKGLSAPAATDLRARLRAGNIDMLVVKKTLIRRAVADAGLPDVDEFLSGQMALAFTSGDPAESAKIFREFSETHNDVPAITGMLLEGVSLPGSSAAELAALPSREALLGQLAATLNQPMTMLAGTLNGAMTKLARTLSSLADQKT